MERDNSINNVVDQLFGGRVNHYHNSETVYSGSSSRYDFARYFAGRKPKPILFLPKQENFIGAHFTLDQDEELIPNDELAKIKDPDEYKRLIRKRLRVLEKKYKH